MSFIFRLVSFSNEFVYLLPTMLRFLNELENLEVSLKLQKGQFPIKFIFRLLSFSNEFVYNYYLQC